MRYIRKRDIYIVGQYLGKIMQGVGILVLIPLIVALIYQEHIAYIGFVIPAILSILIGTLLTKIEVKRPRMAIKHAMLISSLAWLWASFIGGLVMVLCLDISFIDAFFENMSAWTGTGITMFLDVESLPNSILFLRSLEQWIGGLGIVVIVIGTLVYTGTAASRLYKSEAREDRIKPSIANTLKKTLQIYFVYTAIGIALFIIAGMPVFDSINNTFTAISTGGMSIKNLNMGYYNNNLFYMISMLIMILGATSFLTHYRVFKTKGKAIFKDIQFIAMIGLIAVSSIIIYFATNLIPMDIVYNVVSAITTTGASIDSVAATAAWPGFFKIIIISLMIIGGAAGSTVGAVKLSRIITILRGLSKNIINNISPEGRIVKIKSSGRAIGDSEVTEASSYLSIYILFLLGGWLVLTFYGYDGINSLFDISSAQGNVGLSTGIITPSTPLIAKIVVIFNMWIGRLEIIPVLILIRSGLELFKIFIPSKKPI